MNAAQRLEKVVQHLRLSYNKLSVEIGLKDNVSIYHIKNSRNDISPSIAKKITDTFDQISYTWLLTGEGTMLKHSKNMQQAVHISQQFMAVPMVPIHAQAGFFSGYGDQAYMDELPVQYWEVDKEFKGNYVCFEVRGDSMDDDSSKAILEGDKLLTREIQRHLWKSKLHINKWNFVIVHREEGIIVKKIIEHDTTTSSIRCHSLNPIYNDFTLNLNDVIALYNVVDLKRKPQV